MRNDNCLIVYLSMIDNSSNKKQNKIRKKTTELNKDEIGHNELII